MRALMSFTFVATISLGLTSCNKKEFTGPTVDAFVGRLTHEGNPVSFSADETVRLELFHESSQSFLIPIQPDGTFKIGWMPIGKYSATLTREKPGGKGSRSRHSISDGLRIEEGKTEYSIELGKNWKPK